MKLLLFLFGAALAAGLYFVLADLLKIPRLATERALISAGRKERSISSCACSSGMRTTLSVPPAAIMFRS